MGERNVYRWQHKCCSMRCAFIGTGGSCLPRRLKARFAAQTALSKGHLKTALGSTRLASLWRTDCLLYQRLSRPERIRLPNSRSLWRLFDIIAVALTHLIPNNSYDLRLILCALIGIAGIGSVAATARMTQASRRLDCRDCLERLRCLVWQSVESYKGYPVCRRDVMLSSAPDPHGAL